MLARMQQVLVVCMGNICRSPMASAVLKAEVQRLGLDEHLAVDSAGVYGGHAGERADSRARKLAVQRGYERARAVCDEDFERFDAILAMDQDNLEQLQRRCPPPHAHKLHLFLAYAGQGPQEVPDPYYGPLQGFENVLALCERAAPQVIQRLLAASRQTP
jgi:protein-tyrosine phosphatase